MSYKQFTYSPDYFSFGPQEHLLEKTGAEMEYYILGI